MLNKNNAKMHLPKIYAFTIVCLAFLSACDKASNNSHTADLATSTAALDSNYQVEKVLQINTLEALKATYGADNVVADSTITQADTNKVQVSVLYPKTEKELKIFWKKGAFQKELASVEAEGSQNIWHLANGISMGTALNDVAEINGKLFSISGFGWTYGGHVVSWEGGKLDHQGLGLAFADGTNALSAEELKNISGDTEYYTNHDLLKKMNPVVVKIWQAK